MRSTLSKSVVMLLLITSAASGQTRVWRVQSPCDSNFSVELPSQLYKVGWFEGSHGAEIGEDRGFDDGAASYVAFQELSKKRQLGIVIIDQSKVLPKVARSEYERGNFPGAQFMIGGDDATETSQKLVRVNGLLGREYVYAKEIREDTYTRGRIFYLDGRLYFIIFVAASADDLASPDADRFLNSFRVIKRR